MFLIVVKSQILIQKLSYFSLGIPKYLTILKICISNVVKHF